MGKLAGVDEPVQHDRRPSWRPGQGAAACSSSRTSSSSPSRTPTPWTRWSARRPGWPPANLGTEDRVKDAGGPGRRDASSPRKGTIGWMDAEMIVKGGQNNELILPFLETGRAGRVHRGELPQVRSAAVQRGGLQDPREPGRAGARRPLPLQQARDGPHDDPQGPGLSTAAPIRALQRGLRGLTRTPSSVTSSRRSHQAPPASVRSAGSHGYGGSAVPAGRRRPARSCSLLPMAVMFVFSLLADELGSRHRPRLDARQLHRLLQRARPTSAPSSRRSSWPPR